MPWKAYVEDHPRFGPVYARVHHQPAWVTRLAIAAGLFVLAVPFVLIALAVLAALVVTAAVFAVLSLVHRGLTTLRGLFTGGIGGHGDSGRRNVRVIHRH